MRTRLRTKIALPLFVMFCVVASLFSATAAGETVVYDNFGDGDATDGEPATWSMAFGGTQTVEDDSLLITAFSATFPASWIVAPMSHFSDISVRTQMRLLEGEQIGLAVRYNPDGDNRGSYGGFIWGDRAVVGIGGSVGEIFAETPIDLDVMSEDLMLQFDVFGDSLELWAWPVGTDMPIVPTVSAVNDEEEFGRMFVWASLGNTIGPSATAAFRFVQISTTPIRDAAVGDYNGNSELDAGDLDLQAIQIVADPGDPTCDLNNDGVVDFGDRQIWVSELKNTWIGDTNLNGVFTAATWLRCLPKVSTRRAKPPAGK